MQKKYRVTLESDERMHRTGSRSSACLSSQHAQFDRRAPVRLLGIDPSRRGKPLVAGDASKLASWPSTRCSSTRCPQRECSDASCGETFWVTARSREAVDARSDRTSFQPTVCPERPLEPGDESRSNLPMESRFENGGRRSPSCSSWVRTMGAACFSRPSAPTPAPHFLPVVTWVQAAGSSSGPSHNLWAGLGGSRR